MRSIWLPLPLLLVAGASRLSPVAAQDSGSQSAVPVYVPGYRSQNWEGLAGSVLSSDSTATTYTVFCADASDCQISGPLPFTFAQGPSTFSYSGSIESQLTAIISCRLASTTAATCTEYSSFGPDFKENNMTGATETSRTVSYSGNDVQWGTLPVMTTPAPASNLASPTAESPDGMTFDPTDTAWFFPPPTGNSWAEEKSGPRSPLLLGLSVIYVAAAVLV